MNRNQVKQKNLKFYNSFLFTLLFFLFSCSDSMNSSNVYQASDFVDSSTSLDCTGMWENSPLCIERNEALIELKRLEALFIKINENDSTTSLIDQVKVIRSEGNKFYNDEFYFKARDSYVEASKLIITFQDKNLSQLRRYIIDINTLLNLDKIEEARILLDDAQSLGVISTELNLLAERVKNYNTILKLIESSRNLLLLKSYDEALNTINDAIALDNIRDDLKNLKLSIVNQRNNYYFDLYIKNAYKALNTQDILTALKYTNNAKSIYPKNTELLILEKEVLKEKKQFDLSNFLKNGELNYSQENWEISIVEYKSALELSPDDILIKDSITKLNKIISIKSKLDSFIASPNRLSSSNIRENLKKTINNSKKLNLQNEKKLIELINDAQILYTRFNTMVLLNITSNNKTYIDIQKTLQFAPFMNETIKLYPGKYTLIAKRKGVQSFRKEIIINPDYKNVFYTAVCDSTCNIYESKNTLTSHNSGITKESINPVPSLEFLSKNTKDSFDYIVGAKINNNLFTKNLVCNQVTRNNSFKVTFSVSVNNTGSVLATKIIDNTLSTLSADDRKVIVIIDRALKKSKFKLPKNNNVISAGRIKYSVSVPKNFCEA